MGLVALLAGTSALVIKAYRWLRNQGSAGDTALTSIHQQAAVLGTFANFVFALIEALTTLKVASSRVTQIVPASTTGIGRPAGYSPPSALVVPSG